MRNLTPSARILRLGRLTNSAVSFHGKHAHYATHNSGIMIRYDSKLEKYILKMYNITVRKKKEKDVVRFLNKEISHE